MIELAFVAATAVALAVFVIVSRARLRSRRRGAMDEARRRAMQAIAEAMERELGLEVGAQDETRMLLTGRVGLRAIEVRLGAREMHEATVEILEPRAIPDGLRLVEVSDSRELVESMQEGAGDVDGFFTAHGPSLTRLHPRVRDVLVAYAKPKRAAYAWWWVTVEDTRIVAALPEVGTVEALHEVIRLAESIDAAARFGSSATS